MAGNDPVMLSPRSRRAPRMSTRGQPEAVPVQLEQEAASSVQVESEPEEVVFRTGVPNFVLRKVVASDMVETVLASISPTLAVATKIQRVRGSFVKSWGAMAKVFYYIFQGTTENVVSARLTDTKYTQTSDFTVASAAARNAAAVSGRAAADGTAKGKVFYLKKIGTGDASYTPFVDFSKTRRYLDAAQFASGVNPRWFDSTNLAEKAAVLIAFRHMLVKIIMWNEAIVRGHTKIPERFGTLYKRQWQRVPKDRIQEAEDNGDFNLVDEYERRNKMIVVHDQFVQILQNRPTFFSQLEREISSRGIFGNSMVVLFAFTYNMLEYALHTFQALMRVRTIYTRPPRDSENPSAYSTAQALAFHRDKAAAAQIGLLLADIYQNWTLRFKDVGGVSETTMNTIAASLVGLANVIASDKEKKRVIAERIPFFVFFIELYDSPEFDLKNEALMRFRDTPNPVPKDIKNFVFDFANNIFFRPNAADFFNERSPMARAGWRYKLRDEQVDDIRANLSKLGGVE